MVLTVTGCASSIETPLQGFVGLKLGSFCKELDDQKHPQLLHLLSHQCLVPDRRFADFHKFALQQ